MNTKPFRALGMLVIPWLLTMAVLLAGQPLLGETRAIFNNRRVLLARWETRVDNAGKEVRHGNFQRFAPNGNILLQGYYHDNVPVGIWSWWNEEGFLVRQVDRRGKTDQVLYGKSLDDPSTTFRNTAGRKIAEGMMKASKGHGEWHYWFDDGTPKARGNFRSGIPDGSWVYYHRNGQIQRRMEYRLGVLHGTFFTSYENGQERLKGKMDNGLRQGLWRFWYLTGQIRARGLFREDREEGEWRYWKDNGELEQRLFFQVGKAAKRLPLPTRADEKRRVIPHAETLLHPPRLFNEEDQEILRKAY